MIPQKLIETIRACIPMNRLSIVVSCILLLSLTASVLWVIVAFVEADKNFKLGFIGAILSVVITLITHYKTKQREIEARLFQEKAKVYNEIFGLIVNLFKNSKDATNETSDVSIDANTIFNIKQGLLVWGSLESVEAWSALEEINDTDTRVIFSKYERLYRALRKDLGHKDILKTPFAFTRIFLNAEGRADLENLK